MWTKDPAYGAVALHLPFNGTHGDTTFTDVSLYASSVIRNGDVSISNVQSKFGGTSARFNGGHLKVTNSAAFGQRLTSPERCFQFWLRLDSVATQQFVFHLPGSSTSYDIGLRVNAGGGFTFGMGSGMSFGPSTQYFFANTWQHVAVSYGPINGSYGGGYPSGSGTARVDGINRSQYAGGTALQSGGADVYLGASSTGSQPMLGYMQDFQYVHRHVYSRDDIELPDGIQPSTLGVDAADLIGPDAAFDVGGQPAAQVKVASTPIRKEGNWTFLGNSRIVGTVKEKAMPSNLPLVRKVRLFREIDGLFVAETWSDAAGNYSFDFIDRSYRYTVVSYDYTNTYRAVIADNLLPELMP